MNDKTLLPAFNSDDGEEIPKGYFRSWTGKLVSNRATRLPPAYVDPLLITAMEEASRRAGLTVEETLEQLCKEFVVRQGVRVDHIPGFRQTKGQDISVQAPTGLRF